MKKLNQAQLESLHKYVREELRKRCFFVDITLEEVEEAKAELYWKLKK